MGLPIGEWYEESDDCVVDDVNSDSEGVLANEAKDERDWETGASVNDTDVEVDDEPGDDWTETDDGELGACASGCESGRKDGTKSPALGLRGPVEEATDSGGDGGARGGMGVEREECGEPDMIECKKFGDN